MRFGVILADSDDELGMHGVDREICEAMGRFIVYRGGFTSMR